MTLFNSPIRSAQRGFTLIEVLIAVLILGIGLLGAAALQLLSLQNISNAELRTQATLFAQELSELARTASNPSTFVQASGSTASCSALSGEFELWCDEMSHTLPGSTFVSTWSGANLEFTTTITWPERVMYFETANSPAGEGTSSYTLITRFTP
ncbi:type IV pilus modification protein PilV [uncultured Marinobacter sp.]|uniref:type IV pilus modification protein PilV n=1 Tax=uncultured Marinobacter sp. TaxID=187379 RepID=UPI00262C8CA8|nr:type IV pilus modification protein PilV [uncultured Marinobacter sp.]